MRHIVYMRHTLVGTMSVVRIPAFETFDLLDIHPLQSIPGTPLLGLQYLTINMAANNYSEPNPAGPFSPSPQPPTSRHPEV